MKAVQVAVLAVGLGMISMSAIAVPLTYTETQTINAGSTLNFPNSFTFNFTTPTFVPTSGATLLTSSLGDWSYQGNNGGELASSESMSVTLDGNLISNDLFHLNSNLDPISPLKNDNSSAIFQTINISQALLSSLVIDGVLSLEYTLRPEVNISSGNSFITSTISYNYDPAPTVPEPASLALLGLGLGGLAFSRRKRTTSVK